MSPEPVERTGAGRAREKVLATFVHDGWIPKLPAKRGKRRIVLEHVVTCFEPGIRYPERMVDAILRAWHTDYCSLRRYLVDEELLAREGGVYWRIGGPVDLEVIDSLQTAD